MEHRKEYEEWAEVLQRLLDLDVDKDWLKAFLREHNIGTQGSNADRNVAFVKRLEQEILKKMSQASITADG